MPTIRHLQLGHELRVVCAGTSDVIGTGVLQLRSQIEVARDALFEGWMTLSAEVKNGIVDTLPIRQKVVVEDDLPSDARHLGEPQARNAGRAAG